MRKTSRILIVFTLLMLVMSSAVFATRKDVEDKHADWAFGDKKNQWGFVYLLGQDEDGLLDEGKLTPYFKINEDKSPHNYTIKGAYITDGQDVDTTLGIRLGVDYSPYVAKFDGKNRMVGLRVSTFEFDLGPVTLGLDGAYMFTNFNIPGGNSQHGAPANNKVFGPRRNDLLLDVAVDVDVLEGVALDVALNRYSVENTVVDEGPYDYYHNVAAEANAEVLPGLNVSGLYAFYSQEKDWLYEVTADYEVLADQLWVRAGHRNSKFYDKVGDDRVETSWDKMSVLGGHSNNSQLRYIGDTKPLDNFWKRNNSINVGATYKFVYDVLSATLKADYDTTNPSNRDDFDDKVTVSLDATALDFRLYQAFAATLVDDDTTTAVRDKMVADGLIFDRDKNRFDYELDFYTPEYALPVDFADVFAQAKVNFDWDNNYLAENRSHVIGSVELGASFDVWRLDGMYLGAIFAYDMPSDKDMIEDAFKFALVSKYDAPNGIGFRLEYQNSPDYADDSTWVHAKALNDRYDDIRHYGNSKFDGIRLTIGFPL